MTMGFLESIRGKLLDRQYRLRPQFRAILECMVELEPRYTIPAIDHPIIRPNGWIFVYLKKDDPNTPRLFLTEAGEPYTQDLLDADIEDFCQRTGSDDRERLFLTDMVMAMFLDGTWESFGVR